MTKKLSRIFGMMIVCYGLGSFMVVVDLARVPVINQDYAREHSDASQWRHLNRNESTDSLDPAWRVQNREIGRAHV